MTTIWKCFGDYLKYIKCLGHYLYIYIYILNVNVEGNQQISSLYTSRKIQKSSRVCRRLCYPPVSSNMTRWESHGKIHGNPESIGGSTGRCPPPIVSCFVIPSYHRSIIDIFSDLDGIIVILTLDAS